jgi:hypothetical protein
MPWRCALSDLRWAWLCLGLLACCALPLRAQTTAPLLPASAQWTYDVSGRAKGLPYRASATLHWAHDGRRYQARMQFKALLVGTRTQTSEGAWTVTGLQPHLFVDESRRTRRSTFAWTQQQYRYERADRPPATFPLEPDTQDRLSLFFHLGQSLARRGAAPAGGTVLTVPVAGSSGVQQWQFRFAGTETLALPAGAFVVWKLERRPREAGDTAMELWFSPESGFLPVRLRLTESDGDEMDQRLAVRQAITARP